MNKQRMSIAAFTICGLMCFLSFCAVAEVSASISQTGTVVGNLDPDNNGSHYAWGENIGWINFAPAQGPGVLVADTGLTGKAWGENIGWITLDPANGGVKNDGQGNLSGYAWGENVGWINFSGVKIDPATGIFHGQAWGENIGWISFSTGGPVAFAVNTSWRQFGGTGHVVTATAGTGGTISGNGLSCTDGTCTGVYDSIAQITLTATPDAGYMFTGWSGACTGTGPCAVTMDQARNVTANFYRVQGPLAYIANAADDTVSVIDTVNYRVVVAIPVGSQPIAAEVDRTGTRVYVVNTRGGDLSVIDTGLNRVIATIGLGSAPAGLAIAPSSDKVYVANSLSDTLSVIDAANNLVVGNIATGSHPFGVAVSPDGRRIYVTNRYSGTVSVIDAENDQVITEIGVGNNPLAVTLNAAGTRAYVVNYDNGDSISVIDTAANKVIATIDNGAGTAPEAIVLNPSGTRAYVTNELADSVSVIDTSRYQVVEVISVGKNPAGIGISPDGSRLLVNNALDNTVSVIDPVTNRVTGLITTGNRPWTVWGNFIGPMPSTCAPQPSGLVAWWRANGDAHDVIGGNNGTLMNGATFAPGMARQAFRFDGVNDYGEISNNALLDLGAGNFSIDFWINLATLSLDQVFFAKESSWGKSYWMEFDTPNSLRFGVAESPSNMNDLNVPTSLVTGQWYHVTGVRTGNTLQIYLDGALLGEQTNGTGMDTGTGGWARFGRCTEDSACTRFLSGEMDEAQIYNRALTPPEIAAIYNAGSAGTCNAAAVTGSIAINNNAPFTNTRTVTLNLACPDAISGCSSMELSNDNIHWYEPVPYAPTTTWTLTPGDGQKTVSVIFKDNAGNRSGVYAAIITLDTTANLLAVEKAGMGRGTATSNIGAINCGAVCADVYGSGSTVILAAAPDQWSTFTGWGGACSGTGACTVTMDQTKNVTAYFVSQRLAAGYYHTATVRGDGTVWTWGRNNAGQLGDGSWTDSSVPVQASGLTDAIAVAGGAHFTTALKSDGTVWAWGANYSSQLGDGTANTSNASVQVSGLVNVVAIGSGQDHSLALKSDGTVWTWGANAGGRLGDGTTTSRSVPVQVSALNGIVTVAAGDAHSVALKNDGTVWAWGSNNGAQLGNGTWTDSSVPVQVNGLTGVKAISAGAVFTEALRRDGTVWTWGWNEAGRLGNGLNNNSNVPVQVMGLSGVDALVAGFGHSLAMKNDGTVWAWGWNYFGQLGDGSTSDRHAPVQVGGMAGVTDITAGHGHSAALLSDGALKVWGWNGYGQLGDGAPVAASAPALLNDLSGIAKIAAGNNHSLAVGAGGAAWSWGLNNYGQLGNGTLTGSAIPVQVLDAAGTGAFLGITAISGGEYQSAAIQNNSTVWNWGYNWGGRMGIGTNTSGSSLPVAPGIPGKTITSVDTGLDFTVALAGDGTVWTWGSNNWGELGNGTNTESFTPVPVTSLNGYSITRVAAGSRHALALRSDGTVWTWGANWGGQVGDGTQTDRNAPAQVSGLSDIVEIAGGWGFSLALRNDGTVWAWGQDGRLGDGTWTLSSLPVQVKGLSHIAALAAGIDHSLALKNDGTVWAWGNNSYGQLGDGTRDWRTLPVQVSGLSHIIGLASGDNHSLAINESGGVYAWGWNGYGQLGNGATPWRTTPVALANFTMPPLDLSGTLDNGAVTVTTGGDSAWYGQQTVSTSGGSAAQSGNVGDGQSTWMETMVIGPALVTFDWKVSSEADYDYLCFLVDGVEQPGCISGEVDWQRRQYAVPAGSHRVRWIYEKTAWSSGGADAGWVDNIQVCPGEYAIAPGSVALPSGGGEGTVSISSLSGSCSWLATSISPWLTVASAGQGSGDGAITFSTPSQTGVIPRRGTIMVAGKTVSITQSGITGNTFVVTDAGDSGPGTLRDAVASANDNDRILFDPGLKGSIITLTSGEILLSKNIIISGPGASDLTISGNNTSPIFRVTSGAELLLSRLTLAHSHEDAGALSSDEGGRLAIDRCVFMNNNGLALDLDGGDVTITNSSFIGNGNSGAIVHDSGILTIKNCTFSGNTGGADGATIWEGSTLVMESSTFANNSSAAGAIVNYGKMMVRNSTLSGNLGGPVISNNNGHVSLANTILAGNAGGNCAGNITDLGSNIEDGSSCGFTASSSRSNTDPMLDPAGLKNNGGPTQTIALLPGSPALDAGNDALSSASDQRGVPRPQGSHCDIGAYELATGFVIGRDTSLSDAILGLKILSGVDPAGQSINLDLDVNGDGKIGLQEIIYIMQKEAVLRP